MTAQPVDRRGHLRVLLGAVQVAEEHVVPEPHPPRPRLDPGEVHAARGQLGQAVHEPARRGRRRPRKQAPSARRAAATGLGAPARATQQTGRGSPRRPPSPRRARPRRRARRRGASRSPRAGPARAASPPSPRAPRPPSTARTRAPPRAAAPPGTARTARAPAGASAPCAPVGPQACSSATSTYVTRWTISPTIATSGASKTSASSVPAHRALARVLERDEPALGLPALHRPDHGLDRRAAPRARPPRPTRAARRASSSRAEPRVQAARISPPGPRSRARRPARAGSPRRPPPARAGARRGRPPPACSTAARSRGG